MSTQPLTDESGSIRGNAAVDEWIVRGEALLQAAIEEYHAIDARLDALQGHLVAKGAEVEQLAEVLKKRVELKKRRLAAELVIEERPSVKPAAPSAPKQHTTTRHASRSMSLRFIREASAMAARMARMAMARSVVSGRNWVQSHTF